MEMLILHYFEWSLAVRHQICELEIARKPVSHSYGSYEVKPEQRQVCQVILCERFLIEMCVNQPETPERFSSQRIAFQFWDKYPSCIADNYMSDSAGPFDQNTDLSVDFEGDFCEVSCKFRGYNFTGYPPPVYPFECIQVTGLES
ncbi:MAG: hypothetical protein RDU01_05940 [Thermodesulfovibrionales bacterium]|nr:hypothetical protein [Thermodesulfovibrionales bacterium]